jgi:hypothetical protein
MLLLALLIPSAWAGHTCIPESKTLVFHSDHLPPMPAAGSKKVWGANAMEGGEFAGGKALLFGPSYLKALAQANARGLETFAYLEGKCGLTGGRDDGEIAKCARKRPNWKGGGWQDFTFDQLRASVALRIDHCEIDNVFGDLPDSQALALLKKYKELYDRGEIRCKLVLKNNGVSLLGKIGKTFGRGSPHTDFISPFSIFEDDNTAKKAALDRAFAELKGSREVSTYISTDTNHYGSAFHGGPFASCKPADGAGGGGTNPGAAR